jgi:hypothetical protein
MHVESTDDDNDGSERWLCDGSGVLSLWRRATFTYRQILTKYISNS